LTVFFIRLKSVHNAVPMSLLPTKFSLFLTTLPSAKTRPKPTPRSRLSLRPHLVSKLSKTKTKTFKLKVGIRPK